MHIRHGSNWCQLTWKFTIPLAAVLLSCLYNVLKDTAFFSVFWWVYMRTFSHMEWSIEKPSRFQISLTFPSLILFVHYKKWNAHKKWPYAMVRWLMSKKTISGYLTFLFIYSLYSIECKFSAPNKISPAPVLQVLSGNSLLNTGRVLSPDCWWPEPLQSC